MSRVRRPVPPRLSCSTICFRQWPLPAALAAIRDLGFAGADVGTLPGFCDHFDFVNAPPGAERALHDAVAASGLRVFTFTTNIGEFNAPGADVERVLAAGRRNLRAAAALGAGAVVFNCGAWLDRREQPFSEGVARVAEGLRLLAPEAEALGVGLLIEAPHKAKLCRDVDEALALLGRIGHPWARLIYDCNHHHAAGWSPADAIHRLGARSIGLVHLRDAVGRENRYPLGAGEIDFRTLVEVLEGAGYSGRYSLEFTDAADSVEATKEVLLRSIDHLAACGLPAS